MNLFEEFKLAELREESKLEKPVKLKYIDDDIEKGIEYDWGLIFKEYKALKVPRHFYNPTRAMFENSKYGVLLSARNLGKTTNVLLIGMCMNKLYGTEVQYIRRQESELAPSHAMELVATIRSYDNGRYIRQLTEGRYNDIIYHWKAFYYAERNEEGKVVNKAVRPFMYCLSIDRMRDYKSSYNAPLGDLIIFDEFIAKGAHYWEDEFLDFQNLINTIIRRRFSAYICMLANTITNVNMYFDELSIGRIVKKMSKGDKKIIQTPKGTKIYVEFIDAEINKTKKAAAHNELYFGFENPGMVAITGQGDWAVQYQPHINEKEEEREIIWNNVVVNYAPSEYIRLKLVTDVKGLHIEVAPCTKTYEDDFILSLDKVSAQYYGFGTPDFEQLLRSMRISNHIQYANNELCDILEDYMIRSAQAQRLL